MLLSKVVESMRSVLRDTEMAPPAWSAVLWEMTESEMVRVERSSVLAWLIRMAPPRSLVEQWVMWTLVSETEASVSSDASRKTAPPSSTAWERVMLEFDTVPLVRVK